MAGARTAAGGRHGWGSGGMGREWVREDTAEVGRLLGKLPSVVNTEREHAGSAREGAAERFLLPDLDKKYISVHKSQSYVDGLDCNKWLNCQNPK